MSKNIKEITINLGSREICLTIEECMVIKDVLVSLNISKAIQSNVSDLKSYYDNKKLPQTTNERIGKFHITEKRYNPLPIWYYNEF